MYILIAVALLAALSYVVSRGSRGTVQSITDEQARLAAQEIVEYGSNVAQAVQKLRLRGITDTEISFENNVFRRMDNTLEQVAGEFPNCTSAECKVFDPGGGAITPIIIPDMALVDLSDQAGTTLLRPGHSWFASIRVEDVGTTNNDLVLRIPFLETETCMKINDLLNIDNPGGNPPQDPPTGWAQYENSYGGSGIIGDDETDLAGKTAFCARWNGGSLGDDRENHFYQVLITR